MTFEYVALRNPSFTSSGSQEPSGPWEQAAFLALRCMGLEGCMWRTQSAGKVAVFIASDRRSGAHVLNLLTGCMRSPGRGPRGSAYRIWTRQGKGWPL